MKRTHHDPSTGGRRDARTAHVVAAGDAAHEPSLFLLLRHHVAAAITPGARIGHVSIRIAKVHRQLVAIGAARALRAEVEVAQLAAGVVATASRDAKAFAAGITNENVTR